MSDYTGTLGEFLFSEIDNNEYLQELYSDILYNYTKKLFKLEKSPSKELNIEHALRFADILSKSNHSVNADKHKIISQEMVALLNELYPNNDNIKYYLGSVLDNVGNFQGKDMIVPDYNSRNLFDKIFSNFSVEYMTIPAEPTKRFINSQKAIYDNLNNDYLSYSAPTSMGKSFVMRMFIKKQILDNKSMNFALLVPTKALINEVSSKIIKDLKELLNDKNYRIVTSSESLSLKGNHNFIFVLTPERLLYLLINNTEIQITYLFVDEAHKISSADKRSAFYYKVVDMLALRETPPHIAFASPNIPNPEIYLKLIPNANLDNKITTSYSPVSQIKYLIDLVDKQLLAHNNFTGNNDFIAPIKSSIDMSDIIQRLGSSYQNIVYCHSKTNAIDFAVKYATKLTSINDKQLLELSQDVKNEVHDDYYLAELILKGVAYHIGYLPSSIRLRLENAYKDGLIKTIFCTSTLIEGVNLPADNLFVTSYKNGRSHMKDVDFKNLIGRVGRIEYNLYGNVFLLKLDNKLKQEKYEELLTSNVAEQKLSIVTELTKHKKQHIVNSLLKGDVEILKTNKKQSQDDYDLMRKFAIILLKDITSNRNSIVKTQFDMCLTPEKEQKIRDLFSSKKSLLDNDINISIDQTESLENAIKNGLNYPSIAENKIDFEELVVFLNKLHKIFKWNIYENSTIGKRQALRWYAVILSMWIQGYGLNYIIKQSINYKKSNPQTGVWFNGRCIYDTYTDTKENRNYIISETLSVIDNVILFSFSNYFLRFSSEYKKIHNVKYFPNDWYEYIEFGTTNSLTIFLQKNGFSREASDYIKKNSSTYIEKEGDIIKLKRTLMECKNITVQMEALDIQYNMPELFC